MKYDQLEKRIAALEKQLEDDKLKLDFAINSWKIVLLQFVEDFQVSSPEIDSMIELLKATVKR